MCFLFAAGCYSPNLRYWYNDNIEAMGTFKSRNNVVYGAVSVGNDTVPYNGRQPFAIRLPSGTVLSSDDFSLETIRPIALALLKTRDSTVHISHDTKNDRHKYFFENVMFEYEGNQLITMRISRWWEKENGKGSISAIAKTASDTFHLLPVPEKTLNEIFGPPDKTEDFFKW
jgi:hypothetical protein